jgi:uncharacterized protein DUF6624
MHEGRQFRSGENMNRQLLDELLAMAQRDSDTRTRLLNAGRLYGDYAQEMQRVHEENANRLDEIVAQYGWPGISIVGLAGCRAAWLVAQHAICTPDLQRKFLAVMRRASESGDVPKRQVACLSDRIRFNESKPQLYGTVLDWNETGELSCELEDPENVDARRREVGLPAFAEDLAKHREEVEREGGKAPENYAEYKRKGREWARQVGWA